MRLWDMLIAIDDPAFIFYIGLQLITRLRGSLLLADPELIPEIFSKIGFTGEEDVDYIVRAAVATYRSSPRCFKRTLRLCSVTNPELSPLSTYASSTTLKVNKLRAHINKKKNCKQTLITMQDNEDSSTPLPPAPSTSAASEEKKNEKKKKKKSASSSPRTPSTTTSSVNSASNASNTTSRTKKLTVKQQRMAKAEQRRRYGLDLAMAIQSVRSCVMISAAELVEALTQFPIPQLQPVHTPGSASATAAVAAAAATDKQQQQPLFAEDASASVYNNNYMLIDVRPLSECDEVGAGVIPKAICIDPQFIDNPDVLEPWMQHLDSLKGLHIVIIDMPIVKLPERALIRRLLFGEYDGLSPSSTIYGLHNRQLSSTPDENNNSNSGTSSGGGSGSDPMHLYQQQRDEQSPFAAAEEEAIYDDLHNRPGITLARHLQRAHFPCVSVLDKGFPSLVAQLMHVRGDVEPVIINHDSVKWNNYMTWVQKQQQQMGNNSIGDGNSSSSSGHNQNSVYNEDVIVGGQGRHTGSNKKHRKKTRSTSADNNSGDGGSGGGGGGVGLGIAWGALFGFATNQSATTRDSLGGGSTRSEDDSEDGLVLGLDDEEDESDLFEDSYSNSNPGDEASEETDDQEEEDDEDDRDEAEDIDGVEEAGEENTTAVRDGSETASVETMIKQAADPNLSSPSSASRRKSTSAAMLASAYRAAARLGHANMEAIFKARLSSLTPSSSASASASAVTGNSSGKSASVISYLSAAEDFELIAPTSQQDSDGGSSVSVSPATPANTPVTTTSSILTPQSLTPSLPSSSSRKSSSTYSMVENDIGVNAFAAIATPTSTPAPTGASTTPVDSGDVINAGSAMSDIANDYYHVSSSRMKHNSAVVERLLQQQEDEDNEDDGVIIMNK
jgi:hypothetical protein